MKNVVYQIYPKSFCDTNDDGIGDIKGITKKLDYIASLGADTIWLCPVFCSPMVDNGYDISDYMNIDSVFGTKDDMRELIDKANKKGIGILLDLVLNHTSDKHKWFQNAISDENSKYRDYYIFKKSGEAPPNNWRSNFGGSAWESVGNGYYYLHTFAKEQPDLNWENPKMREELYKMIQYWLDMGVAGFRIDAISFIKKNPLFPSLVPDATDGLANPGDNWLVHDGIGEFLSEMRDKCFKPYRAYTVAEANGLNNEQLAEYIGENGYFSAVFDFSYTDIDLTNGNWHTLHDINKNELKKAIFNSQIFLSKVGHGAVYLENHDQNRSPNKYLTPSEISYESITMLGVLYFFLQGTAYIYQGQELGLVNYPWQSLDQFNDVSTIDQYNRAIQAGFTKAQAFQIIAHRSRDNARIPMPWDSSITTGFTKANTAWLPFYKNENNTVENQYNSRSVLSFYRKMCSLRQGELAALFYDGFFRPLFESEYGIFAYERVLHRKTATIICNFQNKATTLLLPNGKILISNTEKSGEIGGEQILKPFEAIVILAEGKNGF